jgi:hypothetical protein
MIEQATRRGKPIPRVERMPWAAMDEHLRHEWKPGEHFGVYAPTGHGKSLLTVRGLLPRWRYVVTFDVKGDDPELVKGTGPRVRTFPRRAQLARYELDERNPQMHFRLNPGGMGASAIRAFDDAFRQVWSLGGTRKAAGAWTLNIDEARILSDNMGMKKHLQTVLVLGRSKGLTVISGSQAPRMLPSECYDQPRWFAIGPIRDKRQVDRFAEIGGDMDLIRGVLPTLERTKNRREFLFLGPEDFTAISSWEPRR